MSIHQGDMLYVSDLDTVVLFCNDSGGQFGPGPQTRVFQPEYVSGLLHFGRSLRFPFPFSQWRVTIAHLCTSSTAFTRDEPLRWGEYLQEYTPRSSWTVGLSPSSLESRSSHRGIRKGNTRPMRSPGKISEMSWCRARRPWDLFTPQPEIHVIPQSQIQIRDTVDCHAA